MKKFTLLLLPLALIACGEPSTDTTKEPTAPSVETATPAAEPTMSDDEYKKRLDSLMDGVSYTLNADGVVTFDNVSDMMTAFNDYQYDGQFKVSGDNPVYLELYEISTEANTKENLAYEQNKALLYGIYKPFTYTNIDKITVSAGVKDMKDPSKVIVKPITLTVTKEQALKALQTHTDAKDFKDLVADTSADFVLKGYSRSKISEILYKDEIQQAIIKDLQK
ncbi:hypothetical protein [Moraxella bovoculi]|uniref:hypothetical protein n=1 Tax=Moraxella bovoculi TaxID=386891 RepID=UPI000624F045|nr:hypothetical protein [Moraxella bovoculi]AKG11472.1 hypothetical protein AAX07_05115 [Moraxella bovoculi]